MKSLVTAALFVATLFYASCKLDNINPYQSKSTSDTLKKSPADPTTQGPVAGVWKWSAQYDYGGIEGDLLTPASTGIQETLTLNTDSSWTQARNGNVVNSGTYKLVNVVTPVGPRVFLGLINHLYPNAQVYDNFDFSTGFVGTYACSSDSLIFYGVYNTLALANVATERVYVK